MCSQFFNSIVVILNDQTPPQGYTKVDVNLNSILRGDAIYLWYRTSPKNPDTLRDGIQEVAIEFGKQAVTPFGWSKINVDLNSEKNGKSGFGEPTFLFIKKGYKGNEMEIKVESVVLRCIIIRVTKGETTCI